MKRHIDIKGTYNIRDIGDYQTKDGGRIKWRKLLRAGKLSNINVEEFDRLKELNLKSICDFRTTHEQTASPDKWYKLEEINRFSFPIGEGRLDKPDWMKKASMGEGKDSYLYKANRSYVRKNTPQYKAFFEILLDESNYPLLYHCTAGKDRTGFATVLLLSALGVSQETIVEDYLLTNEYMPKFDKIDIKKASARLGYDATRLRPLFVVKEIYLQGAYDAIADEYGTMEHFLKEKIGIGAPEIERLQHILVENK